MPLKKMYKKKTYRKKTYKKRLTRKSYRNPNNIGGPNTAKIIQNSTPAAPDFLANRAYIGVRNGIVGARALALAEEFGLYRIAKLTIKFKPKSDTFVSNAGFIGGNGAITVPYLYYMINRYGDWPAVMNEEYFKTMGAKPVRFDDKEISVSWKPNILLGTAANGGSDSGQVKMTPWLSTDAAVGDNAFNPSTTAHYGIGFLVSAAVNGDGSAPVGNFEVIAVYEFKQPRYIPASSSQQVVQHVETFQI